MTAARRTGSGTTAARTSTSPYHIWRDTFDLSCQSENLLLIYLTFLTLMSKYAMNKFGGQMRSIHGGHWADRLRPALYRYLPQRHRRGTLLGAWLRPRGQEVTWCPRYINYLFYPQPSSIRINKYDIVSPRIILFYTQIKTNFKQIYGNWDITGGQFWHATNTRFRATVTAIHRSQRRVQLFLSVEMAP